MLDHYPHSEAGLGLFVTILNKSECKMLGESLTVIIVAEYDGDYRTLSTHFNITPTTTPQDFINHFLHLTDIQGHGESLKDLFNTNAQFL